MASILYLCPMVEVPFGDTWSREPQGLVVLRGASGWRRASICQPRGALLPFTALVVERDTLTNTAFETAVPNAIKIGDADRFDQLWDSTDMVTGQRRTRINTIATQLGLTVTDLTQLGPMVQRLWRRLERAAAPDMYAPVIPTGPQTITDNFNRADGTLGSNWEEVEGADWEVVSNAARYTNVSGTFHTARRIESAFPDNQYAQAMIERTGAGNYSSPAPRMGATGTCYLILADATGCDLRYHTGGGGFTLVDSVADTNAADTMTLFKIDCQGTTIAVDKSGSNLFTRTDSNVTAGKPGLLAIRENADFDDFECTDASGGGGGLHPTRLVHDAGQAMRLRRRARMFLGGL